MFKRVTFEEWQIIITVAAFILCFLTFAYFAWRALKMKDSHRDHMANLPLEDETSTKNKHE